MTEEKPPESQVMESAPKYFIEGVSEILLQLKDDLYQVQKDLNDYSKETQKEILRSRELSENKITPMWYTMPEIELTIKLEYVEREEIMIENNIEKRVNRMKLVPAQRKLKIETQANRKKEIRIK